MVKHICNFDVNPTHISLLIYFSILFDQVNLIVKVTPMILVITLVYLETTLTLSILLKREPTSKQTPLVEKHAHPPRMV